MKSIPSKVPTTLFVGPMKAGTSWLHEYFKTRNEVCLPSGVKETFYFDQRFEKKSVSWYTRHFNGAAPTQRILEIAPTYFHNVDAPHRVQKTCGVVPIVVTLRDPASRAFSLFQHMRRYGFTRCTDFRTAVEKHPEILQSSQYARCIRMWQNVMGAQNIHVLMMEQLKNDPRGFASSACDIIGISRPTQGDHLPSEVNVASVARSYVVARMGRYAGDGLRSVKLYGAVELAKSFGLKTMFFGKPQKNSARVKMTTEEREWFLTFVQDEIKQLEETLDVDLTSWKQTC